MTLDNAPALDQQIYVASSGNRAVLIVVASELETAEVAVGWVSPPSVEDLAECHAWAQRVFEDGELKLIVEESALAHVN